MGEELTVHYFFFKKHLLFTNIMIIFVSNHSSLMYWYSVAGRNLALRKTKKVDNYIKSKSNALRADDVRVLVNGSVSELDLLGSCSGASPQLQVGVVDFHTNLVQEFCYLYFLVVCNHSASKTIDYFFVLRTGIRYNIEYL